MSAERDHVRRNDAERARLKKLIARSTDADLSHAMPDGWTVAALSDEFIVKNAVTDYLNLSRADHRSEHLVDIERALAEPPTTGLR